MTSSPLHLARRAVSSWKNHPVSATDVEIAARWLLPQELEMWMTMQPRDCRHSLVVHQRFVELCPHATRAEHAAALLHDIGKVMSGLGWWLRIVATVVGPRGERFRRYHDHEALGAQLLAGVSEPRTLELVSGRRTDEVGKALQRADDV